jgi:hypothetical protein
MSVLAAMMAAMWSTVTCLWAKMQYMHIALPWWLWLIPLFIGLGCILLFVEEMRSTQKWIRLSIAVPVFYVAGMVASRFADKLPIN